MPDPDKESFTPDSPLEQPEEDQLGYSEFASHLANTITSRVPTDGYTIGIYGDWGSGKSTILNFVESELKDPDDPPIVVRFNPWWFSGRSDLIEKFFAQLGNVLGDDESLSNIRPKLAELSSTLSKVPFSAATNLPIEQGFSAANSLLQQEGKTIDEIKNQISDELRELDKQIIVILDDIDRLTPSEITQMFQLIRSVANFPNITYILALDQDVVTGALEDEQTIRDGEQYLEKIIQLPINIPTHPSGALRSLLTERLDKIPEVTVADQDRWSRILNRGLMPLIDTPRDVVRLGNTVDTMCATVGDEVNTVDLVGLETLRVFHKDVYDEIRSSPDRFTGYRSAGGLGYSKEQDDYSDVLPPEGEDEETRDGVKAILQILFPKVGQNISNSYSTGGHWNRHRAEMRICHSDRFPVYFRLSIPEGELTASELGSIMSAIDDEEALTGELREMLETDGGEYGSKANVFIDRFSDRFDDIGSSQVPPILNSLFILGDEIIEQGETVSEFSIDDQRRLMFVVEELLKKQESSKRLGTVRNAISGGESPYMSSSFMSWLIHAHENNDSESTNPPALSLDEIDKLKPVVAKQIRKAAQRDSLRDMPRARQMLNQWSEWTDSDSANEWVEDHTNTDEKLIQFIDTISSTAVVNHTTPVHYIDPRWVDDFVSIDEVRERVKGVDKEKLTDEERTIVERFERGDEMLDEDRDPSQADSWFGPW